MELIGMLDSPYVRRVAISLQLLGLPFTHRAVSVFRTFDQFREINPVVKAPTLICDNGTVLMDSTLILDYAESLAAPGKSLMPAPLAERQHSLRIIGLGLAALEKTVQIVYEYHLRPADKLHEPWVDRVTGQLLAALTILDSEVANKPLSADPDRMNQAGVTTAVTWHFVRMMVPEVVPAELCPTLHEYSAAAEQLPQFKAAPHGDSTYGQST